MSQLQIEILPFEKENTSQLLSIWEKSVLATHHFLLADDFLEIKEMLHSFDFKSLAVFCAFENKNMAGFIALHDQKVEMLFVHPNYFGKIVGFQLMQFAVTEHRANQVDVNHQNTAAKQFYEKLGFKTFAIHPIDDRGKDYPIAKMKRNTL